MILAVDTETSLMQPGDMLQPMVCCSMYAGGYPEQSWLTRDHDLIRSNLFSAETLVFHNAPYDLEVFITSGVLTRDEAESLLPKIRDTKTREKLIAIKDNDSRMKFSLAELSAKYLGKHRDKFTHRLSYGELMDVPIENWDFGAKNYALEDAEDTYKVFRAQTYTSPDEEMQIRADWVMFQMTARGVHVDRALHQKLVTECQVVERETLDRLLALGVMRENKKNKSGLSKNMAAIRTRIEIAYGGAAPLTAGGATSTSRETIENAPHAPELEDLCQLNYVQKIMSTYLEGMDGDILNSSYNILVDTGRTSCYGPSKGMMDQGFRGTNLQNLPRGRRFGEGPWIREMIVPAPGKKFFVADWNSMELRCLAQVCLTLFGTSNMARRYQDDPGYDPHLDFAARLLGRDPPEVLDKEWKDMRQLGKVANFGVPGGMSARTLVKWAWAVYRVEITPGQAQELIDRFLLANPVMREYFALVNDLADRELTQLYSGRVRGGASYCATANSFFQGLGADVLKQALWDARDLYLVMQTHDEIVGESSEPEQDLARLIEIMERPYLPDVPLVAEGQVMERFGK